MLFFCLWTGLIVSGFFVHYVFFNSRLDQQELEDLSYNDFMPSGWDIKLEVYTSIIEEPVTKIVSLNNPTAGEDIDRSQHDLCYRKGIDIDESDYFESGKTMKNKCVRTKLAEYTDKFDIQF